MISQLKPANVKVLSLTTIATPHRGIIGLFIFEPVYVTNISFRRLLVCRCHVLLDWPFVTFSLLSYRLPITDTTRSHTATNIPKLYKVLEFFGFETGAFSQLTQKYMQENFNQKTPDREGISYYSYGATVDPRFWSMFRQSHRIIQKLEGENDGLVSVKSAKWGTYKGTLKDVSHLDMINWTNRLRWFMWELTGNKRKYVSDPLSSITSVY
jgi:triacylglycerol lipase